MNYRDTDPLDREFEAMERHDAAIERHAAEEARANDQRMAEDAKPFDPIRAGIDRVAEQAEALGYERGYHAGFKHAQQLYEAVMKGLK